MKVQFWLVSGYEASGEIDPNPTEGTDLHRGTNLDSGGEMWVFWDEPLNRWQEVDVDLLRRGTDDNEQGRSGA